MEKNGQSSVKPEPISVGPWTVQLQSGKECVTPRISAEGEQVAGEAVYLLCRCEKKGEPRASAHFPF